MAKISKRYDYFIAAFNAHLTSLSFFQAKKENAFVELPAWFVEVLKHIFYGTRHSSFDLLTVHYQVEAMDSRQLYVKLKIAVDETFDLESSASWEVSFVLSLPAKSDAITFLTYFRRTSLDYMCALKRMPGKSVQTASSDLVNSLFYDLPEQDDFEEQFESSSRCFEFSTIVKDNGSHIEMTDNTN